jgi:hypothetical protein
MSGMHESMMKTMIMLFQYLFSITFRMNGRVSQSTSAPEVTLPVYGVGDMNSKKISNMASIYTPTLSVFGRVQMSMSPKTRDFRGLAAADAACLQASLRQTKKDCKYQHQTKLFWPCPFHLQQLFAGH